VGRPEHPGAVSPDITGSWRLVSWEVSSEGGGSEQPFGPDPRGLLIYSADGERLTLRAETGERRHVLEWRRA
jgi:lipocalin-like protein